MKRSHLAEDALLVPLGVVEPLDLQGPDVSPEHGARLGGGAADADAAGRALLGVGVAGGGVRGGGSVGKIFFVLWHVGVWIGGGKDELAEGQSSCLIVQNTKT